MHSKEYLEGIRLFNEGHFWHAHEQWEECWLHSSEPDSTFYKGIIQAAAALVHWQKGNPRGLHLNWAKSRPKLASLPSPYMGVDLTALLAAMDDFEARSPDTHAQPPHLVFADNSPYAVA